MPYSYKEAMHVQTGGRRLARLAERRARCGRDRQNFAISRLRPSKPWQIARFLTG